MVGMTFKVAKAAVYDSGAYTASNDPFLLPFLTYLWLGIWWRVTGVPASYLQPPTQPLPDSNLVPDEKRGSPHATQ